VSEEQVVELLERRRQMERDAEEMASRNFYDPPVRYRTGNALWKGLCVLLLVYGIGLIGVIEIHYHAVQVFNWCVKVYSDLLGLAASR